MDKHINSKNDVMNKHDRVYKVSQLQDSSDEKKDNYESAIKYFSSTNSVDSIAIPNHRIDRYGLFKEKIISKLYTRIEYAKKQMPISIRERFKKYAKQEENCENAIGIILRGDLDRNSINREETIANMLNHKNKELSEVVIETLNEVKIKREVSNDTKEQIYVSYTNKEENTYSSNNRILEEQWNKFDEKRKKEELKEELKSLRRFLAIYKSNGETSPIQSNKEKAKEAYKCQKWLELLDPIPGRQLKEPKGMTQPITTDPKEALDCFLKFQVEEGYTEIEQNLHRSLKALQEKINSILL